MSEPIDELEDWRKAKALDLEAAGVTGRDAAPLPRLQPYSDAYERHLDASGYAKPNGLPVGRQPFKLSVEAVEELVEEIKRLKNRLQWLESNLCAKHLELQTCSSGPCHACLLKQEEECVAQLESNIRFLQERLASLPVGESTRDLHSIICQAVTLLNQGDTLKAHTLLRQTLAEYIEPVGESREPLPTAN